MKGIIIVIISLIAQISSKSIQFEGHELPEDCYAGRIPVETCCSMPESWMQSMANPNSCYSFYTCLVNTPVFMPCDRGLHFSVRERKCVSPEIAECQFATTTTTTPIPLGICRNTPRSCRHGLINPETCCKGVSDNDVALLQNNNDCNSYYQCVNWEPVLQRCQAGLQWNADSCRCEWAESSTCQY